jgi:hypothetical protein
MGQPIPFDRPDDPVYHTLPLRYVVELPVLGITVRFESNSPAALDLIEEVFGVWRGLSASPELVEPASSVRIRLIVHDGDEGAAPHAPVVCRLPDAERLLVQTPGSVGLVDLQRRDAVAYITPALLADRAHAQYALLHILTFPLVVQFDRYPVLAAVIARGPVALLLAGPAGTGKSTLALQAHRHGLQVLSDDVAYIQLKPVFRVWGDVPGRVYLTLDAGAHFPDLAGHAPTLLASGIEKLLVRFPYEWSGRGGGAPMASRAGVCLLERNGGRASLATASPQEVQAFLGKELGIARTMFGPRVDDAVALLAGGSAWKLSLSADPADALPFLDTMLAALEQSDD